MRKSYLREHRGNPFDFRSVVFVPALHVLLAFGECPTDHKFNTHACVWNDTSSVVTCTRVGFHPTQTMVRGAPSIISTLGSTVPYRCLIVWHWPPMAFADPCIAWDCNASGHRTIHTHIQRIEVIASHTTLQIQALLLRSRHPAQVRVCVNNFRALRDGP